MDGSDSISAQFKSSFHSIGRNTPSPTEIVSRAELHVNAFPLHAQGWMVYLAALKSLFGSAKTTFSMLRKKN